MFDNRKSFKKDILCSKCQDVEDVVCKCLRLFYLCFVLTLQTYVGKMQRKKTKKQRIKEQKNKHRHRA